MKVTIAVCLSCQAAALCIPRGVHVSVDHPITWGLGYTVFTLGQDGFRPTTLPYNFVRLTW